MTCMKSYEEFVLGTYEALLVDCASYYPALTREFARDYSRVRSAVDCQGIQFVLDILPAFRKHFDICLSKGRLTKSGLAQLRPYRRRGVIPRLFRGLLLRVFDDNGALRCDPDKEAIRLLRQLFGIAKRIEIASSRRDTARAARDFFRIDREVKSGDLRWDNHFDFDAEGAAELSFTDAQQNSLSTESQLEFNLETDPKPLPLDYPEILASIQRNADLITAYLGYFNPLEWKPRHGPGAVSDRRWGAYKYAFPSWSDKLEHVFPYADLAHANYAMAAQDSLVSPLTPSFRNEERSKLIAVPKTLSTPRLIASEPTSNQWCQQVVKDFLYERSSKTYISRFISFKDQTLNGKLALRASQDQSHATIDLSSASDRVSCWHVERLFRRSPSLLQALQSCRTGWIEQRLCRDVPTFQRVRKYSTMGNATIFPVQSLFFLAVALGVVCHIRRIRATPRSLRHLGSMEVRVFGDDIIVPIDCAEVVVDVLTSLGLRVNPNKTFLTGRFKESCGVDAYDGHNVTSVSILKRPVRTSPGSLVSSVDVHHNLCSAGLVATAAYIRKVAARTVSNQIPFVKHGSGLFGWSDLFGTEDTHTKVRYNRDLMRAEVRCLRPKVSEQRSTAVESAGLLQFFTEAAKEVTTSTSSIGWLLQRPKAGLGLGWVPLG